MHGPGAFVIFGPSLFIWIGPTLVLEKYCNTLEPLANPSRLQVGDEESFLDLGRGVIRYVVDDGCQDNILSRMEE